MSVSMRTAKLTIIPKYYEDKTGRNRFSADVVEPVTYPVNLSPEGGIPVPQLEAVLKNCADNFEPVEITYVMGKDNWGKQSLTVFAVEPDKKPSAPAKANL